MTLNSPFNPYTIIEYQIPEKSFVTIKVYDVLGNEVVTLVNEEKVSGTYSVSLDASELSSGVYFYKLEATPNGGQSGNFVSTKKMIVLK